MGPAAEKGPHPPDRAVPVPPLSGGHPLVSSAPDQGALQPTERVLSKGPLPTEGRLPLRDRVPRQPHPSCLGAPHREEAPFPVDEDGERAVLTSSDPSFGRTHLDSQLPTRVLLKADFPIFGNEPLHKMRWVSDPWRAMNLGCRHEVPRVRVPAYGLTYRP